MYRLLIEDDEGRTTIVPLIRNQINIGREEGNTIRLTERNVSRRHARLALRDGQIVIEDLQSYNGVWINGNRVDSSIVVNPGDLLEIGDYHLSIQEEASDVERKARPSLPPDQDFDEQTPPLGVPPIKASEDGNTSLPSRLVVINTNLSGREYILSKSEMTIGRTDDNDICLDHASVSRNHAKIVQQGDAYQLLDLGSANGIQVNGEEYGVCDLRWGDIVELGQVRLRFTSPESATETPIAVPETAAVPAPAASHQSVAAPANPKSTTPLIIGAILLIALLGGGAWFLMGPSRESGNNKNLKGVGIEPRKKLPPAPSDAINTPEGQKRLFTQAEEHFLSESYDEALRILIKLLSVRSDWAQAKDLKKRTVEGKKDYNVLEEAKGLKSEGDLLGAYKKYKFLIDKKSRYTAKAQKMCEDMLPEVLKSLMEQATRALNQKKPYEAKQFALEALKLQPEHEDAKTMLKTVEEQIKQGGRRPPPRRAGSPLPGTSPKPSRRRRIKKRRRRRKKARRRAKVRKRRVAVVRKAPPPQRAPKTTSVNRKQCAKYYKQRKYRTAYSCFRTYAQAHPTDAAVYVMLGSTAGKIGNCNGSQRDLRYCFKSRKYYRRYLLLAPSGPYAARVRKALKNNK